jgi:hypothetical protein
VLLVAGSAAMEIQLGMTLKILSPKRHEWSPRYLVRVVDNGMLESTNLVLRARKKHLMSDHAIFDQILIVRSSHE